MLAALEPSDDPRAEVTTEKDMDARPEDPRDPAADTSQEWMALASPTAVRSPDSAVVTQRWPVDAEPPDSRNPELCAAQRCVAPALPEAGRLPVAPVAIEKPVDAEPAFGADPLAAVSQA